MIVDTTTTRTRSSTTRTSATGTTATTMSFTTSTATYTIPSQPGTSTTCLTNKDVRNLWASAATYDSGLNRNAYPELRRQMVVGKANLNLLGFFEDARWDITTSYTSDFDGRLGFDKDAAVLWKRVKDNTCILAFRGSNTLQDVGMQTGALNAKILANPMKVQGQNFRVAHHLYDEYYYLQEEMDPMVFQGCSSLEVTGHSLGASMAGLHAVFINVPNDPLKWWSSPRVAQNVVGKRVNHMYLFAPVPMWYGRIWSYNWQGSPTYSANGPGDDPNRCFSGGVYRSITESGNTYKQDFTGHSGPANAKRVYTKADYVDMFQNSAQGYYTSIYACATNNDVAMHNHADRYAVWPSSTYCNHDPERYMRSLVNGATGCSEASGRFWVQQGCDGSTIESSPSQAA